MVWEKQGIFWGWIRARGRISSWVYSAMVVLNSWFSPWSRCLERSSSSKCWRWECLLPSSPNLLQSQRVGMIPVESFDPLKHWVLILAVSTSTLLPDPRQGAANFP